MTPMTAAVMGSVPPQHAGVASAATNTSRELGGVFGIALLGAVVTGAFNRAFEANLLAQGLPVQAVKSIVAKAGNAAAAGAAPAAGAVGDAVRESFVHAIHVGMLTAIGFQILAALISYLFVRSHVGIEHPSDEPAALTAL
jgi:hypothetical protein